MNLDNKITTAMDFRNPEPKVKLRRDLCEYERKSMIELRLFAKDDFKIFLRDGLVFLRNRHKHPESYALLEKDQKIKLGKGDEHSLIYLVHSIVDVSKSVETRMDISSRNDFDLLLLRFSKEIQERGYDPKNISPEHGMMYAQSSYIRTKSGKLRMI